MIFYDHTDTFRYDMGTGIQRVVKQLGYALAAEAPAHFRPIVFSRGAFRRCGLRGPGAGVARIQTFRRLVRQIDCTPVNLLRKLASEYGVLRRLKAGFWEFLEDPKLLSPAVRLEQGDWYLTADSIWERSEFMAKLKALRAHRVSTAVVHYDLAPVTHSQWCHPNFTRAFVPYAEALPDFDIVFCISDFVREEFLSYCRRKGFTHPAVITIPLGHEIDYLTSDKLSEETRALREPFVLCVGSVDPRKNHRMLLTAFDIVWERGVKLSLVIVGRPGYASGEMLDRIRTHPRFGTSLFYLPNCSDGELTQLYQRCAFTIAVSLFEGFGLPLIESLARGKACVSSSIPVFRAIAGDFGVYVNPDDPKAIAEGICGLFEDQERLESLTLLIRTKYSPPSWKDCARVVLEALGPNQGANLLRATVGSLRR